VSLTDADMVAFERATADDVAAIVALLADDAVAVTRESERLVPYSNAFEVIDADPRQMLVVGRFGGRVVACLQLTIVTALTDGGTTRAEIEGVRVHRDLRGRGIGNVVLWWVIERARERGCSVVRLMTSSDEPDARRFYEKRGFEVSHHELKRRL